ncbi:CoA-binding protein [Halapricum desulfuricans]|uniref:Putative CoA-binding protein n=1 Tax=Halapricum desulfuricans TaxID=2841257 RepID=A0A897NMA3_9EURY|nr:CoA-binding protein [Halapricum desulfuricans]QSG13892.1 putative CoA-binding protein [Halapricum desulfuricans]
MPVTDDETIETILDSETIAVVGCSTTPGKAAHDVPKYLLEHGYDVIPVNPFAEEVFDRPAYDSLSDVPDEIDVVDVFRPSGEVPEIVTSVLERDDIDTVWLQQGITDEASGRRVESSDRQFVQDRCLKVEHRRLRTD